MNFIKRKELLWENYKNEIYKHYIALDWSKVNFALASIRDTGTKYKVVEHPADLFVNRRWCSKKFACFIS